MHMLEPFLLHLCKVSDSTTEEGRRALRERLAAAALQGMLANPQVMTFYAEHGNLLNTLPQEIVAVADATLSALWAARQGEGEK